jgi:hypothetical protein
MKYQQLLLLVITIYSLCTFVQAVDRRRNSIFDVVVSTEPEESSQPQERPDNRHTRTRHVLAATHTTHQGNVESDPFSNVVLLSENEDALVRALKYQYGSLPPSSPGTVVSSHRDVIGPLRVECILQYLITVLLRCIVVCSCRV